MESVVTEIRTALARARLPYKEAAAKVGVSASSFYHWVTGDGSALRIRDLVRIAEATGHTVEIRFIEKGRNHGQASESDRVGA